MGEEHSPTTSRARLRALTSLAGAGLLAGAALLAGVPVAHAAGTPAPATTVPAQGAAGDQVGSVVGRTAPDATGESASEAPSGEPGSLFGSVQAESGSDAPSGEDKSVENATDEEPPFGMRPWIVWTAAGVTTLLVGLGVVVAATSFPRGKGPRHG